MGAHSGVTQGLACLEKGLLGLKWFLMMIWKSKENSGTLPHSKETEEPPGIPSSLLRWSRLVARSHFQQKLKNSKGWIHQGSHYPLVLTAQGPRHQLLPWCKYPAGNYKLGERGKLRQHHMDFLSSNLEIFCICGRLAGERDQARRPCSVFRRRLGYGSLQNYTHQCAAMVRMRQSSPGG